MFSQTLNDFKESENVLKNSKTNEKINLIESASTDNSYTDDDEKSVLKNEKYVISNEKSKCETPGCDGKGHIKNKQGKIIHNRHYKIQNCPNK